MYLIFRCRKCGRYLYAPQGIKTRKCVCGHRNDLKRVVVVKRVKSEKEAGEIVRLLQGKSTSFESLDKKIWKFSP